MQVHHDEGVANRIDPESCADAREGIGEALTGERIGQPLSRESTLILGADVVPVTEGNTDGRAKKASEEEKRRDKIQGRAGREEGREKEEGGSRRPTLNLSNRNGLGGGTEAAVTGMCRG
nr:hypothetical protein [Bradyrhizobium algeriense]